jgi:hypothetical protein
VIVNFLVTGLLGLAVWLTSFLPTGATWSPDTSPVSGFLGSLYGLDAYLPITELFICCGIGLAVMNARAPFAVVVWVYRRVRG